MAADRQASSAAQERRVTLKGAVLAEIVAANPQGRLKAVEYDSIGAIRRIEWYDEEADSDADARRALKREAVSATGRAEPS